MRIWSRETGSAVPSRVSVLISILRLNLVLTYGSPPEFRKAHRHFKKGCLVTSVLRRGVPAVNRRFPRRFPPRGLGDIDTLVKGLSRSTNECARARHSLLLPFVVFFYCFVSSFEGSIQSVLSFFLRRWGEKHTNCKARCFWCVRPGSHASVPTAIVSFSVLERTACKDCSLAIHPSSLMS